MKKEKQVTERKPLSDRKPFLVRLKPTHKIFLMRKSKSLGISMAAYLNLMLEDAKHVDAKKAVFSKDE